MDVDCQCDFRNRAYRDSSAASEGDGIVKRAAHYDYVFLFTSAQIQLRKIQPQILKNPCLHALGKGVVQGLVPCFPSFLKTAYSTATLTHSAALPLSCRTEHDIIPSLRRRS